MSYRLMLKCCTFLSFLNVSVCVAVNDSVVFASLFAGYQSEVRPNCGGPGVPDVVKIGMALRQIIDLDEPTQILTAYVWVRMSWKDCRLTWDENTTGVSSFVVPSSTVWTPDITVYENAVSSMLSSTNYRPAVYPDGTVAYNFPSIAKILCEVDVTFFPLDKQICSLTLGTWAHHGFLVNVTKNPGTADSSSYLSNGEWELTDFYSERHELYYGCCPEPYPDVTFYIKLQRRSFFYVVNLIFPCILMSVMSLLGFMLPPDSGEKVSLEITVLLSLAVFMLLVSETMPPTSEYFPHIGTYFAVVMSLVALSCLAAVIVLIFHHRGSQGHRVRPLVRKLFFDWLAPVLIVNTGSETAGGCCPVRAVMCSDPSPTGVSSLTPSTERLFCAPISTECTTVRHHKSTNNNDKDSNTHNTTEKVRQDLELQDVEKVKAVSEEARLLSDNLSCLRDIKVFVDDKKESESIAEEWKTFARILDRLFVVIFMFAQVVSTVVIMVQLTTGR